MPIRLLRLLTVAAMATVLIATSPVDAEQNSADEHTEVPAPALIEESDLTVRISYVGTMPFEVGPGFNQSIIRSNMGSPVAIGDSLYLIDQIDAIYKTNRDGSAPL